MSRFIGRVRERTLLREQSVGPAPALVIVYGRRRVGKSTLIREALHGVRAVLYQAAQVTDAENQALFKAQIARDLGADPLLDAVHGWEAILTRIVERAEAQGRRAVIVLDEFPYLCAANPALPSLLQKVWDTVQARQANVAIILCGSQISFMETLLAQKHPLHGRQTASIDLMPLSFREAAAFFPHWSADDRIRAYGVFGGMPSYLSLARTGETLAENVIRLILSPGGALSEEPERVLLGELHEGHRYATVLRAVADGCTKRGDITNRLAAGEPIKDAGPYLAKLQALRLIRSETSMDVHDPSRARNARYYLHDPFLNFYYRFVFPYRSPLEAGGSARVYETAIAPLLDDYLGDIFERVCREYVRLYGEEIFPTLAWRVGKIWSSTYDIDIAAQLLDRTSFVYGEAKWRRAQMRYETLTALQERAALTSFGRGRKRAYWLLCSRGGFTRPVRDLAARDDTVVLVEVRRLLG